MAADEIGEQAEAGDAAEERRVIVLDPEQDGAGVARGHLSAQVLSAQAGSSGLGQAQYLWVAPGGVLPGEDGVEHLVHFVVQNGAVHLARDADGEERFLFPAAELIQGGLDGAPGLQPEVGGRHFGAARQLAGGQAVEAQGGEVEQAYFDAGGAEVDSEGVRHGGVSSDRLAVISEGILLLEFGKPGQGFVALVCSNHLLEGDRMDAAAQTLGHEGEQEWHQATLAGYTICIEGWVALVVQENEIAAQFDSKEQLAKELVIQRQRADGTGAGRAGKKAVFLQQSPVEPPDVMQIAVAEVLGRVMRIAIAALKNGAATKLMFDKLGFDEQRASVARPLEHQVNGGWLAGILVEYLSVLDFKNRAHDF